MKSSYHRKIVHLSRLSEVAEQHRGASGGGRSIVLCHGCFDIVHPGHVRYLQWAGRAGDVLVVSLTGDDGVEKQDGTRPHVPQELRAENLAALEFVDHVVIVDDPTAEPVIRALRPDIYVKGREYEHSSHPGFLAEKELVEAGGGRVIFSSGDVVFSSTDIVSNLAEQFTDEGFDETVRLRACCERWGIDLPWMRTVFGRGFANKRIAVVGDSVCDRYLFCEQADVAAEAPVLSVRPVTEKSYLGASAIIASHLRALGAEVRLVTTIAPPKDDEPSRQLLETLEGMGITTHAFTTHRALPLKQRYLVEDQKLLKVNHGDTRPLDSAMTRRVVAALDQMAGEGLDAVIFTDFGYGTVTVSLLEQALPLLRPRVGIIAGDVSGPHRTLLAYHGADLLTPTERELRGVVGDFEQSLPAVAGRVMSKLATPNMIVTMGKRGSVLFRPREADRADWFKSRMRSDYVPSLADRVTDVVGAGDAMLATATLAMTAGCTLPQAAYLGSAAAAVAVSRLGNLPVSSEQLLRWASRRGELHSASAAGFSAA